jgi:small neutral amino acid transporter SnatA (MarC family)
VLSIFVLFFGSLGIGWWLGEELQSMIGGFGIVAGFYLLLIGIMMAFRKQIIPSIQNTIIRKIYEEKDNVVSGPDQRETGVAEAA